MRQCKCNHTHRQLNEHNTQTANNAKEVNIGIVSDTCPNINSFLESHTICCRFFPLLSFNCCHFYFSIDIFVREYVVHCEWPVFIFNAAILLSLLIISKELRVSFLLAVTIESKAKIVIKIHSSSSSSSAAPSSSQTNDKTAAVAAATTTFHLLREMQTGFVVHGTIATKMVLLCLCRHQNESISTGFI